MSDVCEICGEPLDEIRNELSEQADYYGVDSLTENQQAFYEDNDPDRCPDCWED